MDRVLKYKMYREINNKIHLSTFKYFIVYDFQVLAYTDFEIQAKKLKHWAYQKYKQSIKGLKFRDIDIVLYRYYTTL